MRDISRKVRTLRTATAGATLLVSPDTICAIAENRIPKGNPLEVAKVAAIQAAKNTSQIIPYCHPLPVDFVGIDFRLGEDRIEIQASVKAVYKTGVEMEALTAASVAALTLYDMMKMLDESMEILGVKLIEKKGGKSDFKDRFPNTLKAAVLVMSDTIAQGKKEDLSGKTIVDRLKEGGVDIVDYKIIPDDLGLIQSTLKSYADDMGLDLIVTTGGTGISPRDCTPEAMSTVIEQEIPGICEAARAYGQDRTPYSMLSRARAGLRGKTLIINLPGSKKGVADSLDAIFPAVLHSFNMLRGGGHPSHETAGAGRSRK